MVAAPDNALAVRWAAQLVQHGTQLSDELLMEAAPDNALAAKWAAQLVAFRTLPSTALLQAMDNDLTPELAKKWLVTLQAVC